MTENNSPKYDIEAIENGLRITQASTLVRLEVIVGGQFGSEGKGHVTAQRVRHHMDQGRQVVNVRVAGPNAGHCVINPETGQKHAFRSLPVGAAYGRDVICAIAPGSEIDMTVLAKEMEEVKQALGEYPVLVVDPEATLLTQEHIDIEQMSDLNSRLGSTAKGIGSARSSRIWRKAQRVQDSDEAVNQILGWGGAVLPLKMAIDSPDTDAVVIEGTQGYGLGLHAGRYPQCTSSDCRAIDFLAMAGISPWDPRFAGMQIWIAARVYPIRVAGNSGPLQGETSWDELGLPEEHTTVTQKVRRVGEWDAQLLRDAVLANGGGNNVPYVRLALTMVDQKFPYVEGHTEMEEMFTDEVYTWVKEVEAQTGAPVGMLTTSPDTAVLL